VNSFESNYREKNLIVLREERRWVGVNIEGETKGSSLKLYFRTGVCADDYHYVKPEWEGKKLEYRIKPDPHD